MIYTKLCQQSKRVVFAVHSGETDWYEVQWYGWKCPADKTYCY